MMKPVSRADEVCVWSGPTQNIADTKVALLSAHLWLFVWLFVSVNT